jgi:hypothetical protein
VEDEKPGLPKNHPRRPDCLSKAISKLLGGSDSDGGGEGNTKLNTEMPLLWARGEVK